MSEGNRAAHTANQQESSPLRPDIVAGLTAAAVVLPKAMAYATVAGLPVAVGLYTAFIPMAIFTARVSSPLYLQFWPARQLGFPVEYSSIVGARLLTPPTRSNVKIVLTTKDIAR